MNDPETHLSNKNNFLKSLNPVYGANIPKIRNTL